MPYHSGKIRILPLLIACLILPSCVSNVGYYTKVNNLVSAGDTAGALSTVDSSKESVYGEKNALLYHLDRGFLLHISSGYAESTADFDSVKRLYDDYFTKSITTEASTLLINDNMRPYYGEDYERALVNVFSAINYIMLGRDNDALVEARQADHFLTTLQVNYGYKDAYKEDAFVRYLMGMIYENQGEINDAYISYRQALDAYKYYEKNYGVATPQKLVSDALRTAKMLGFSSEIAEIKKNWPAAAAAGTSSPADGNTGELVILDYNGLSPEKVDTFFEISFGEGWAYVEGMKVEGDDRAKVDQARALVRSIAAEEQVRIAFPKFVPLGYAIGGALAETEDGRLYPGETVEDIGAIAVKGLDDRIARIRIRAIARGIIKFALTKEISRKVEQSSGELSGWLTQKVLTAAATATELSDKRSWRTLPDKIIMLRVPLTAGQHSVTLKYYDRNNQTIFTETLNNITIKPGKKSFFLVRTAR